MKPIRNLKNETKQTGFLKATKVWFVFPIIAFVLALAIFSVATYADGLPEVTFISSDGMTYNSYTESPIQIRVTFNEDISNTPTVSIAPDGGAQDVDDCGDLDAKTFCFDYTIPESTENLETITVSDAKDAEDNTMLENSGHHFNVDTIVPGGYSISGIDLIGNDFSFTFADAEVGVSYSYTIRDILAGEIDDTGSIATGTDTIGPIDVSSLADGLLTLGVQLTDAAGNTGDVMIYTITKNVIPECGGDVACQCGDTLTADRTLNESDYLVGCSNYGLTIGADNVTLDCNGTSITGDGTWEGEYAYRGVYTEYDGATIKNCDISGFYNGIRTNDGIGNTITGNTLHDDWKGVWINYDSYDLIEGNNASYNEDAGIVARYGGYNEGNNQIIENNVDHNTYGGGLSQSGIRLYEEYADVVQGNNITYSGDRGIYSEDSYDISIIGNNISLGEEGILIDGDEGDIIQGNDINDNVDMGIFSVYSWGSQISGNNITNNGEDYDWVGGGIFLLYDEGTTIESNTLTDNLYNDIITWNSQFNEISSNNFTNVQVFGLSVVNDDDGRGNGYGYDYIYNNIFTGADYYSAITTDTVDNEIAGNNITCEGDCSDGTIGIDLSEDWFNYYDISSSGANVSVSSILEKTYNISQPANMTERRAQEASAHSSFVKDMLENVNYQLATAAKADSSFDVGSIYDNYLNDLYENEISGAYYGIYTDISWPNVASGGNYHDNLYGVYTNGGWRQVIADSSIHDNCVGLYGGDDKIYSINTDYTNNKDHTIFGDSDCPTALDGGSTGGETGGIYADADVTVINGNFVNNGDESDPWAIYDDSDYIDWHVSESVNCANNTVSVNELSGASNINADSCPIDIYETSASCGGDIACSCGDTLTESRILNESEDELTDCPGDGLLIKTNDVTLDCDGNSITGDGGHYGVYASGRNITITNCDIEGFYNGIRSEWSGSPSCDYSDGTVITTNGIYENEVGVYLSNDQGDIIQRNDISDNYDAGIVAKGKIHTWNNQILGNYLEENAWDCGWICSGIKLEYEDSDVIQGNEIVDTYGNGIELENSRDTQILGNYLDDNYDSPTDAQIAIDADNNDMGYGSSNNIQGNTLIDSGSSAISIYTDNNAVTNNAIDCESGAFGIILNYAGLPKSNEQLLTTTSKHKAVVDKTLPVISEKWKEYATSDSSSGMKTSGSSGFNVADGKGGYNDQLYGNSFSENTVGNCSVAGFGAIDAYSSTVNHDTYQENDLGMLVLGSNPFFFASSIAITNTTIDGNCAGAIIGSSDVDMADTNITNNPGDGCMVPTTYGSGLQSIHSSIDLVNGNYENNLYGDYTPDTFYGIFDDGAVTAKSPNTTGMGAGVAYIDWFINQNVACSNNDIKIMGSIVPVGGKIIPNNCKVSTWNSSIGDFGDWQELNLTGGEIGSLSLTVITGPDNQATVGGLEYGVELDINTTGGVLGNVNVQYYDQNPGNSGYSLTALGHYVTFTPDAGLEAALDYMTIKMYYTDEEVAAAGLNEDTLRIEYYNDTDGTWTTYDDPNGGVNTVENYVWANVTHFSAYGIFGSSGVAKKVSGAGAQTVGIFVGGEQPVITSPVTPSVEAPTAAPTTTPLPPPSETDWVTISLVILAIIGIGFWYLRFGKKKRYVAG